MPDEETPTPEESAEETPQPEGASEEAPQAEDAAPDEDAQPLSAAEQLAQDALAAAKAAVDGINTGEPIEGAPDDTQAAIAAAQSAVDSIGSDVASASSFEMPSLDTAVLDGQLEGGLDLLSDVNLNVKIELGRTRMFLEDVLKMTEGSVVELDKLAGDPVDIYVNDRHVATGEVLILNDNFCVRINEIISGAAPARAG
ncbi:MAG: flagellar motor switch protein FliN [Planctomycetota bacterium]|jgi:flagellar motor switch protein FliN/FliY